MMLRLALKDILHDWLLSTCLVLAIASIVAPLLILFGLQFGTIETLRNRLVQDPKNREIRPLTTRSFSKDWFAQLRTSCPEVAFAVPMTRQISASIMATNPAGDLREPLTLLATASGDPLLLENGVQVPEAGGCVLTEAAARALNVTVGDQLSFATQRIIGGGYEHASFPVQVTGILDERASSLRSAFVRLEVIEAVEDFKDGRAVSAYGWKGEQAQAYPVFAGAVVVVPEPLTQLDEVLLINNTGFSQVEQIEAGQVSARIGAIPAPAGSVYLVRVKQRAANEANIQALVNRLRGKGAVVIPWIEPLAISLTPPGSAVAIPLQLRVHTGAVDPTPPGDGTAVRPENGQGLPTVLVGRQSPLAEGEASLTVRVEDRELTLPVRVSKGEVPDGQVQAAADLAGRLNLLRSRSVRYDAATASLLLSRQGYAGFRLYASSIDAVAQVQQQLEGQGIAVHTEQERIGEVRRLDHYTTLIFWMIAGVGVIGGISALTASLYASVERKKKELNVLRLLGLLKRELVLFPILQGLLLSSAALVLAALLFATVALVINQVFSTHLQAKESLCTLAPSHFLILTTGVWILSVVAATFAALRATRLDPAEALRDE